MAEIHELPHVRRNRTLSDVPAWLLAVLGGLTVLGSLGVSASTMGWYAGALNEKLERVVSDQRRDQDTVRQQFVTLSTSVNSLNATMTGVTVEMKNLAEALGRERQDRIDHELHTKE